MKTQFVGQTRYSLYIPESRAWRATAQPNSAQDYRDYLYAPERMDFRDKVFNELTVPSIAEAARGQELIHIVSFSESLPMKYKESLERTADRYPFIRLQMLPDGTHDWGHVDRFIKEHLEPGVFGRYRLDDDDILSTHYFSEMKRFIKPEFVGMAVSMPLGIEAIYDSGHFYNFRESHLPMNSMGLLYVSELRADGGIRAARAGAHDKSDRFAPVILNSSKIGYLRTNHTGQDNLLRHDQRGVVEKLLSDMDRFPAISSATKLRSDFPVIADSVLNAHASVSIDWNKPLGHGVELEMVGGSQGVTVSVTGNAPQGLREHPIALSLSLRSQRGRALGPRARFAGLSTSISSQIGQFVYLSVEQGEFEATASAYLPENVVISEVRLIPLVSNARNVLIEKITVDCNSGNVHVSALGAGTARKLSFSQKMRKKAFIVAKKYRSLIQPRLVKALGPKRANRVLSFLAAKLG